MLSREGKCHLLKKTRAVLKVPFVNCHIIAFVISAVMRVTSLI